MNQEFTDRLFEKYPELYAGKDLPLTQNLMSFGFECGDGWYQIINALSWGLTQLIKQGQTNLRAVQVKQKWGTLRYYINGSSKEANALIEMAEILSGVTCEACGSIKDVKPTKGWITYLCKNCRKESHGG